jgi:hypothetical protein
MVAFSLLGLAHRLEDPWTSALQTQSAASTDGSQGNVAGPMVNGVTAPDNLEDFAATLGAPDLPLKA